jgi:flagellum-specific peptidoglycan hydrolase FlgJ
MSFFRNATPRLIAVLAGVVLALALTATASAAASPTGEQAKFIEEAGQAARASQDATGVPASVTVAQAILESDWGRSAIGPANNYFGIKAQSGPGPAGVVYANTVEFLNGAYVTVSAPFRAYNSMAESFIDHGRFLVQNSRYAPAFQFTNDPPAFARAIQQAGYATDPSYADKLIAIMDTYDLYRFNQPGANSPQGGAQLAI